jgi:hypothetical protein
LNSRNRLASLVVSLTITPEMLAEMSMPHTVNQQTFAPKLTSLGASWTRKRASEFRVSAVQRLCSPH